MTRSRAAVASDVHARSEQRVDERRGGGARRAKSDVPSKSMTITIGSSHHFLFWARNDQNSLDQAFTLRFGGGLLELVGCVGMSVLLMVRHPRMVKAAADMLELLEVAPQVGRCRLG